MVIPEPHDWEVTDTRLKAACRKLYPWAVLWRHSLDRAVTRNEHEKRAVDEFLDACREEL